ncbi:MAG: DUF1015 domain-containing protein [Deltaproteobacteria bacterium]|jgi:uncharacterized protein (DUF1015 family)|nr:DUF1015 domain-containing protein [Deltaproteobacteria bacterium]
MVKIAPFRGVVYNAKEMETDGGLLIAPPYDVVNEAQRQQYLSSHPHNFLHLDLGEVKPGDSGPMAWHDRSAEILALWLSSGVLIRRDKPSIILMDTEWIHPSTGRRMNRHGLICLMLLEEVGKNSKVRLHEKTFSYHKVERLDLMEKTRAHLSPIFGFFPDPEEDFLRTMYDLHRTGSDFQVNESNGLSHQVFFVQANHSIGKLAEMLADTTVYIADGHHRYETALKYRQMVLDELARNSQQPAPNSAVNYVMTYLSPMSDPGLCVLPTHRVLSCLQYSDEEIIKSLERFCEIKSFTFNGDSEQAKTDLAQKLTDDSKKGLTVFGLFIRGFKRYFFLKVKEKIKDEIVKAQPEEAVLNSLDVSVLTNLIIKKALGLTESEMDNPDCISYVYSIEQAIEAVNERNHRAAFIINATSLDEILKVTETGRVMPRKATYFYPKVSNGLVFNLIDPMESIVELGRG